MIVKSITYCYVLLVYCFCICLFIHAHSTRPSVGKASWYGRRNQGHKTANGERFDKQQMTAASPYLPFGTQIRVLNLENGRSTIVTINDRGPARHLHRILDLSEAAAKELGYREKGLTKVYFSQALFDYESAKIESKLEDNGSAGTLPQTDVSFDSSRMGNY